MPEKSLDDTGLKILLANVVHDAAKYADRAFFRSKWFRLICDFMDWEPEMIRKLASTGVRAQFTIPREFRA